MLTGCVPPDRSGDKGVETVSTSVEAAANEGADCTIEDAAILHLAVDVVGDRARIIIENSGRESFEVRLMAYGLRRGGPYTKSLGRLHVEPGEMVAERPATVFLAQRLGTDPVGITLVAEGTSYSTGIVHRASTRVVFRPDGSSGTENDILGAQLISEKGGERAVAHAERRALPIDTAPEPVVPVAESAANVTMYGQITRVCIENQYMFDDSGTAGEAVWPETVPTFRPMYGAKIDFYRQDLATGVWTVETPLFLMDDPSSSIAGCAYIWDVKSTPFAGDANYYLVIRSEGLAAGHTVRAGRTCAADPTYGCVQTQWVSMRAYLTGPSHYEQVDFQIVPSGEEYNVLGATVFSLNHLGGALLGPDNEKYSFNYLLNSALNESGDPIKLNSYGSARKFIIIHEMAHRLIKQTSNWPGSDCDTAHGHTNLDLQVNAYPCRPVKTPNHHMLSLESHQCGFAEGFAHLTAAETWNDGDPSDCGFSYYKVFPTTTPGTGDDVPQIVNCAGDPGSMSPVHTWRYPIGDAINQCWFAYSLSNFPEAGHSREMDWMRTMYGTLHPLGGNEVSYVELMDVLRYSIDYWPEPWSYDHLWWTLFTYGANWVGSPDLVANWLDASATNGLQGL